MVRYGLITDQSRKAKAAKSVYDYIRLRSRGEPLHDEIVLTWPVSNGVRLVAHDRFRVIDLRLHDEHLSPYFKTDMNLFHLLMIDDKVDMCIYKTADGILFVFDGLPESPHAFGMHGHDMR